MLQRFGGSRAIRNGVGTQDTLSFESCSSSVACDTEGMSFGAFEEDAGQGGDHV